VHGQARPPGPRAAITADWPLVPVLVPVLDAFLVVFVLVFVVFIVLVVGDLHHDLVVLGQKLFERRLRRPRLRFRLLDPSVGRRVGFVLNALLVLLGERIELAKLELARDRFEDFLVLVVALPLQRCNVVGHRPLLSASWRRACPPAHFGRDGHRPRPHALHNIAMT